MSWLAYFAVFAAFFLTHSIPTRPRVRRVLVRWFGQRGFTIAYSCLSLAMLSAVITAAARAPFVPLWDQASWHYPALQMGMFAVCLILAFSLGRTNPFSFGGAGNENFDPERPGIVRWVRHPILLALGLWAALHLLPNGDLAHVFLFGVFAGFAFLGTRLIDRRKQREMTIAHWQETQAAFKALPVSRFGLMKRDVAIRLCAAILIYFALLGFHSHVIGISVAPM
ncbi:MAG: NnrU family protein [Planktotalea sp.]|uniref:NnrU family protein n=1 Tax=Planktotalea sp. TaxID=2029877 RepID=UPI003C770908